VIQARRSAGTIVERTRDPAGRRTVDEEAKRRPGWVTGLRWLGEFAAYAVIALVVVALVRLFLVQPFVVPTGSMENTLMGEGTSATGKTTPGDLILAWKPGALQRGEIVVFRDDLGWLNPLTTKAPAWKQTLAWLKVIAPQDERYLVKRLIGLPGDHVTCCDAQGRMSVNGQPLDETSYLYSDDRGYQASPSDYTFDIVVPAGHIFVMGDHRNNSQDGRAWLCGGGSLGAPGSSPTPEIAFPSVESVQGRVFAILYPFDRWRTFTIPSTFAAVPDPTPGVGPTSWSCPLGPG